MSDGGVFRHIQERFRPVQSQHEAVDFIDTTSTRESNGTPMKDEALVTETSTFLDNEKKHDSETNIDIYSSIILSIVVVTVFTLAALIKGKGGNFTQPQAKILDLTASVIIAPLILSLFNYYCFKIARASTVNEKSGLLYDSSLRALIEVSTTDWGSYSPFKLFELARTKQARTILLAILTLASAISFSALSNVVAYEAFTQTAGMDVDATLQYLYRKPGSTGYMGDGMMGGTQMPLLSTTEQQAKFSSQWFQVLTALSYIPAGPFLDQGAYIGINVTNASLARLPSGTTNLLAVPAYKLTYDCHPTTPDTNTTGLTTTGAMDQQLVINVGLNVNSTATMIYQTRIRNGESTILSADNGVYQILAFEYPGVTTSVMLGNIGTFNTSNCTTMSSFGPLPHCAFNNTLSSGTGFGTTKSILSVWGVKCALTRQQGTIDMNRDLNTTAADWKRSPFTALPSPQDKKEPLPFITNDLQLSPQFVSTVGSIPGLGGALAASSNITAAAVNYTCDDSNDGEDFDTWAQNFLYAEGEARRIAYEIALEEPAPDTDDSRLAYTIVAQSVILRYRMTYLPWILIAGLVALVTAGMSVLGLEVMMGRGLEERRILTPLRVVVDAGAGLERKRFEEVEHAGDEGIEIWGKGTRVRYVRVSDAGGRKGVRLKAD